MIHPAPIRQKNKTLFQLYPNPANDLLRLQKLSDKAFGSFQYTILNTKGQVVTQSSMKLNFEANQLDIPVNHLKDGVYILQLKSGNDLTQLRFLIAR